MTSKQSAEKEQISNCDKAVITMPFMRQVNFVIKSAKRKSQWKKQHNSPHGRS